MMYASHLVYCHEGDHLLVPQCRPILVSSVMLFFFVLRMCSGLVDATIARH